MSKRKSATATSTEPSSLQNLILEKCELNKQIVELEKEIKQTQEQNK